MLDLDICVFQMNPQIGDIEGNIEKIKNKVKSCEQDDCDILVTPELSLLGYPPMDMLRRDTLYEKQSEKIAELKETTIGRDVTVVIGYCRRSTNGLHNSALVLHNGTVLETYDKQLLPTYDVFDGHRYFETGTESGYFEVNGRKIGISICEDAWYSVDVMDMKQHTYNPFEQFTEDTDMIVNLSASPFRYGKHKERVELFHQHSVNTDSTIVFCNQVGGNDELIFDGNSFILTPKGKVSVLSSFEEDSKVIRSVTDTKEESYNMDVIQQIKSALTVGIQDYFEKTGFSTAIVGMSGGIDSSVATVLTVKALGSDNVYGVTMPSEITSTENISDARTVAENLGIEFAEIPIKTSVSAVSDSIQDNTNYTLNSIAAENIQARIRGDILMSLSNTMDSLVITPDNKSESAIGYCTLYGDTVGAIAPLGDCYKKYVYQLGEQFDSIPQQVVDKQPTAELKENQIDTDDMPEYSTLDTILTQYVENRCKPEETAIESKAQIRSIIKQIHAAEFKRNQSPLPLRVTPKDFGRGWRYPISGSYTFLTE